MTTDAGKPLRDEQQVAAQFNADVADHAVRAERDRLRSGLAAMAAERDGLRKKHDSAMDALEIESLICRSAMADNDSLRALCVELVAALASLGDALKPWGGGELTRKIDAVLAHAAEKGIKP